MSLGNNALDDSLERWTKNIYLLVLGIGFSFIVNDVVVNFDGPTAAATTLVYFLALYYFLSYDWIAFSTLIDTYPYIVEPNLTLQYQARFYIDMVHLLVKTMLIYIALRSFDRLTLATAGVLFGTWHILIVLWHLFAKLEFEDYTIPWMSHAVMIGVYAVFVAGVLLAYDRFEPQVASAVFVGVLAAIIICFATWRKQVLIRTYERDALGTARSA